MDGHTSVTMYGVLYRIVLDGCVVDASLLRIVRCFAANSGSRVQQHSKKHRIAILASHVRASRVWQATILWSAFIALLFEVWVGSGVPGPSTVLVLFGRPDRALVEFFFF